MRTKSLFKKVCLIILMFLMINYELFSREPGFEITKECRANLKMLNDTTAKYINDGNYNLPNWGTLESIRVMCFGAKYLPSIPKPPTLDCEYYFIMKDLNHYDWYCNIHGLLGGDKAYTFRYHEYQFTAYIKTLYLYSDKYRQHQENIIRWTNYNPTLMENIKFHYKRNPLYTTILIIGGFLFLIFVYRNIFG